MIISFPAAAICSSSREQHEKAEKWMTWKGRREEKRREEKRREEKGKRKGRNESQSGVSTQRKHKKEKELGHKRKQQAETAAPLSL